MNIKYVAWAGIALILVSPWVGDDVTRSAAVLIDGLVLTLYSVVHVIVEEG